MIRISECLPATITDAETGKTSVGRSVKCLICGGDAHVEPSRQYLTQNRPAPAWAILNCRRCGKTQYPGKTAVEPIEAPPAAPPAPRPDEVPNLSIPEAKKVNSGRKR